MQTQTGYQEAKGRGVSDLAAQVFHTLVNQEAYTPVADVVSWFKIPSQDTAATKAAIKELDNARLLRRNKRGHIAPVPSEAVHDRQALRGMGMSFELRSLGGCIDLNRVIVGGEVKFIITKDQCRAIKEVYNRKCCPKHTIRLASVLSRGMGGRRPFLEYVNPETAAFRIVNPKYGMPRRETASVLYAEA